MTPLGCGRIAWDDVPIADDPIHTTWYPTRSWNGRGQARRWPMGRSTYRPELKRFELQSGVQIPPLCEAWAHPAHICTGPRWGLLGVVRAAVGADRIHRGNSTAQSDASAAKSEHWHAPLIRLTKTQAACTRCSQARCEGAGRTCKLQLARCSAAVPG